MFEFIMRPIAVYVAGDSNTTVELFGNGYNCSMYVSRTISLRMPLKCSKNWEQSQGPGTMLGISEAEKTLVKIKNSVEKKMICSFKAWCD